MTSLTETDYTKADLAYLYLPESGLAYNRQTEFVDTIKSLGNLSIEAYSDAESYDIYVSSTSSLISDKYKTSHISSIEVATNQLALASSSEEEYGVLSDPPVLLDRHNDDQMHNETLSRTLLNRILNLYILNIEKDTYRNNRGPNYGQETIIASRGLIKLFPFINAPILRDHKLADPTMPTLKQSSYSKAYDQSVDRLSKRNANITDSKIYGEAALNTNELMLVQNKLSEISSETTSADWHSIIGDRAENTYKQLAHATPLYRFLYLSNPNFEVPEGYKDNLKRSGRVEELVDQNLYKIEEAEAHKYAYVFELVRNVYSNELLDKMSDDAINAYFSFAEIVSEQKDSAKRLPVFLERVLHNSDDPSVKSLRHAVIVVGNIKPIKKAGQEAFEVREKNVGTAFKRLTKNLKLDKGDANLHILGKRVTNILNQISQQAILINKLN